MAESVRALLSREAIEVVANRSARAMKRGVDRDHGIAGRRERIRQRKRVAAVATRAVLHDRNWPACARDLAVRQPKREVHIVHALDPQLAAGAALERAMHR